MAGAWGDSGEVFGALWLRLEREENHPLGLHKLSRHWGYRGAVFFGLLPLVRVNGGGRKKTTSVFYQRAKEGLVRAKGSFFSDSGRERGFGKKLSLGLN